jgi:hypothetical protein
VSEQPAPSTTTPAHPLDQLLTVLDQWVERMENERDAAEAIPDDIPHFITSPP